MLVLKIQTIDERYTNIPKYPTDFPEQPEGKSREGVAIIIKS